MIASITGLRGRKREPRIAYIDVETFNVDLVVAPDFGTFLGELRVGTQKPMYGLMTQLQKMELRRRAMYSGWVRKLPLFGSGWTQVRDMPAPAKKTFHQQWRNRKV